MRIILFTVAASLFVSLDAIAQTGSYGQHAAYNSISNLGVYEEELPSGYLFLVNDDFQRVLANPAKAYLYDRPFAAISLWNGSSTPVSVGVIMPNKWVMTASVFTGTQNSTTDFNESYSERVTYNQGNDVINESEEQLEFYDREIKDRNNIAELRMLKTWGNGSESGKAFGFFLGVQQQEITQVVNSDRYLRTSFVRFRNDTVTQNLNDNASRFIDFNAIDRINYLKGGFEFYSSSPISESTHKLYVQVTDFDRQESIFTVRFDTSYYVYPSTTANRIDISEEDESIVTDAVPFSVEYQGYLNKKINGLGDDFLFLGLNGRYSSGDLNFNQLRSEEVVIFQNEVEIFTTGTTLTYRNSGNQSRLLSFGVSPGYAIRTTGEDYQLFTGLNPYYQFMGVSDAFLFQEEAYQEVEEKQHSLGLQLPFFGFFDVAEWISIWGGAKLNYTYTINSVKEEQIEKIAPESSSLPDVYNFENTNYDHNIREQLFAGVKINHSSGLTVNTNFRTDLSNFNAWLITVGYSFN